MENKVSLEKWYSALYCYLPTSYEMEEILVLDDAGEIIDEYFKPDYENSNPKQKEFWDKILPRLNNVEKEINAMHDLYDATYEDPDTCNPEEKNFILAMRGVFERLDKITAITHIIDGIEPETEAYKK